MEEKQTKKVRISWIELLEIGALAFIGIVTYYLYLPALNPRSPGFWCFMIWLAILIVVGQWWIQDYYVWEEKRAIGLIILGVTVACSLLCWVSSWQLLHSATAYSIADVAISDNGIVEDFPDLTKPENLENLALTDLDTAITLGDKKIAEVGNASWYDVDEEFNLVRTPDKHYRLSAIDYGGLVKFHKANAKGLPGYVLVEVNPKNGQIIQETEVVEDKTIRYSPGAYWGKDLRRHLRFQYPTCMFDKSFLEIDDNGKPFWVTGILRPKAGVWGVRTVDSVILTDAETGVSEEYAVEETPGWVDHVFSLDYLMRIAYWHYGYEGGFWNNWFGKTNVLRTSYYSRDKSKADDEETAVGKFANFFGYSSTIGKNGNVMFYTGLTAANNAESNMGWLLIDTRTGKMTQYDIVGARESAAQNAVEQLVQQFGYQATFPLPVNIAGEPSYVMCLKGKAGLTQAYGIVSVENYSIAVQAENLNEAIWLYQSKLNGTGPDKIPAEHTQKNIEGATIEAVFTAEIDGVTQFYYQIEGSLYRAAITINELQVTFKIGDKIDFTFYEGKKGEIWQITSIEKKGP